MVGTNRYTLVGLVVVVIIIIAIAGLFVYSNNSHSTVPVDDFYLQHAYTHNNDSELKFI